MIFVFSVFHVQTLSLFIWFVALVALPAKSSAMNSRVDCEGCTKFSQLISAHDPDAASWLYSSCENNNFHHPNFQKSKQKLLTQPSACSDMPCAQLEASCKEASSITAGATWQLQCFWHLLAVKPWENEGISVLSNWNIGQLF